MTAKSISSNWNPGVRQCYETQWTRHTFFTPGSFTSFMSENEPFSKGYTFEGYTVDMPDI